MLVSRALFSAGAGLLLLYIVAIVALLAKGTASREAYVPDDGTIRYEVVSGNGEIHVLEHATDDPAGVLEEAARRFGEVASVKRLQPGDSMPAANAPSRTPIGVLAIALLLFPTGLVAAGFYARTRAQQTHTLWSAINSTLTEDSTALMRQLGTDEAGLRKVMDRLNAEGRVQLLFDVQNKRVYDRRLSDHTITVQFCPRCNEPFNARVIADLLRIPQCSSCMYPVERQELDRLKSGIVQGLRAGVSLDDVSAFSVGLFVVLALLFPPGAIFYGLRHA